jgi:hypothetical protein
MPLAKYSLASWGAAAFAKSESAAPTLSPPLRGNGSCTSSGDGGDALAAGLANVRGLALDAAGDVYLLQFRFVISAPVKVLDCEVRRVDVTNGKLSAVAGNGTCGLSGDGGPD